MKKFNKVILLLLLMSMMLGNTMVAAAEPIKVYVENSKIEMPISPVVDDGRTLVPVRAIFESMGAQVAWEEETQTVIGITEDKTIRLVIGHNKAIINDIEVELDVPAKIIDGSTMVPARFVAESLGATVDWDNNTKSVLVNSDYPYGKYKVTRVVDGDTIIVDFEGKEERVRLIGVDTPESVHPDSTKNVEEGKIASNFTKDKLENNEIALEFDVQERDHYGRLLGYVWFNGEMFNKTLLSEGYAQMATYPPNVKYVDDFMKIQTEARENNKGLWGGQTFNGEVPIEEPPSTKLNVKAGEDATLIMKGTPRVEYSISVYYKSGKSKASGLESKIADSDGNISWTWKVGNKTTPGTYRIVIIGDQTYNYELVVE